MDFSGAPLQRLINLNDLLRSRDFGVGDLLSDQPYMVPRPFFLTVSFPMARTGGEMKLLLASWLCIKADLSLSQLSRLVLSRAAELAY